MKLTRRRIWITASVFAAAFVLILIWFAVSGRDRITQANVDRIQLGMSLEQVSAIFGHAPSVALDYQISNDEPNIVKLYFWDGVQGRARVIIGTSPKTVIDKGFARNRISWWSRVKRFFGL